MTLKTEPVPNAGETLPGPFAVPNKYVGIPESTNGNDILDWWTNEAKKDPEIAKSLMDFLDEYDAKHPVEESPVVKTTRNSGNHLLPETFRVYIDGAPSGPKAFDIPISSDMTFQQLMDKISEIVSADALKQAKDPMPTTSVSTPLTKSTISGFSPPNEEESLTHAERKLDMKNGWHTEILAKTGERVDRHYVDGLLHNDAGPAEKRANGAQLYYRRGQLHREGGMPAFQGLTGTKKYAIDGKYHRLGGEPAVVWSSGPYRHEWWVNGEVQKVITKDGTTKWFAPGATDRDKALLHRTDGPAITHPNGSIQYFLNGRPFPSVTAWELALEQINKDNLNLQRKINEDLIDEDPADTVETTKTFEKKAKNMTKPAMSFTDMIKSNALDAGYRVGATQSTALVRSAIVTLMRKKGANEGAIQGLTTFLETEFGAALISLMIGTGLHYAPTINQDPRVQRLGEEMRIGGMATAGNAVMGELVAQLLPALQEIIQKLPELETGEANGTVRVEETERLTKAMEDEEDAEEAVEKTTKKTVNS